jgi:hypothetical protein
MEVKMHEIEAKKIVEKILIQAPAKEMKGVDSYKTFDSYLQSKINHFIRYPNVNYNGKEIEFLLVGLMEAYKYHHSEEKQKLKRFTHEIEIIDNWKGHDLIEIYRGFDNNFRIKVHLKDKDTGEVKTSLKTIEKDDINRMLRIVNKLIINEVTSCYTISEMMNMDWKNDIWKNRTKVYFKQYYYPLKVMESLKLIKYHGSGKITRII